MKMTGQMLKEAREKQQLSLSEISMATKINHKVLKAMEKGDLEELPARTFLRGFVHSYASYLKLDTNKVMQVFQEELGPSAQETSEIEDLAAQVISGKTLPSTMDSSKMFKYSAVAGIVVLIFIVMGVKQLVEKYEREKEIEPPPATLETLVPAEVPANSPPPTEAADKKNSDLDSPPPEKAESTEKVATPSTTKSEPAPPAPTTTNTPPVKTAAPEPIKPTAPPVAPPEKTPPPVQTVTPPNNVTATATGGSAAPPEKTTATPSGATKEVILEAFDRIEVVVQVDKEALKKIVLQPDEVHTIKGQGKIQLDLSDGGAVNLIVNGKDLGVPGDLGKPKKVELP
ncbi:MAG: helix-turn-helix domain-containing protein [Bdellovibrionales bacterium]|nr:helix-turn-helix domain-containing protein [Bdellovibrionales bacterium]